MMQQYSSMEFLYLNGNEPSAEVVNSEIYIPFDNMVTGPGNESVFQQVMQSLAQNCTYRDVIVLFISSHGDHDVNGPFISLPNGDRIYANELKQILDNILCEKRIIIINSCFSGDFIVIYRIIKI